MKAINVFVDNSTVNRILEIDTSEIRGASYEEDRLYLSKIMGYAEQGIVKLIVNPSVKEEIKKTSNPQRREELLALFNQFHFTPYNKTIFTFTFPAHFVTEEEGGVLEELREKIKGFEKDEKTFLDALANPQVEVLLTTDREHLACIKLRDYLANKGLDKKIKVFTPKEFYEYLQKVEN